ncbi:MAG: hypothetical protein QF886_09835 [Planctomycetota bacterium]|jgi:hypothetical protein|nr:hypothetical protein [Planctomycetota bacterium]
MFEAIRLTRQRGVFLLELSVYILAGSIILATVSAAYISLYHGTAAVARQAAFLSSVDRMRGALLEDLSRCEGLIKKKGEHKADEGTLLLQYPDGRVRIWQRAKGGRGIYVSEINEREESPARVIIRAGEVSFQVIERFGRPVGVRVDVSLAEHHSLKKHPFGSAVCFAAFLRR